MGLIDLFLSRLRATIGYEQSFDDKVQAGDISGALGMMSTDREQVAKAIKEYNIAFHEIMQRQDKPIFDEEGHFKGWVKRWR